MDAIDYFRQHGNHAALETISDGFYIATCST
jgi:hypothetical protein